MNKEKKFYNALEAIFKGAKIEGDSGYVNLLKIKEEYYSSILNQFKSEVDNNKEITQPFKEELFDKLYNFFYKYFSESGSVFFVKTANWQKLYEKIYTANQDVILFWKTQMLYYVKSDILFHSIDINIEDKDSSESYDFYFDVGSLQARQNNVKRKIIYEFRGKEARKNEDGKSSKDIYIFDVMYSTHGRVTKTEEIVKKTNITDVILLKAFKTFEKQSEIDFFINKNSKIFLKEQLDLYLHQMLLNDENKFEQSRLNQIKLIKDFAIKIIDFISQFEDELARVWNKPKFSHSSNYVITLDKLNKKIVQKISEHQGITEQVNEWIELGIVNSDFVLTTQTREDSKYLPIDTRFFKDLELEILALFDNLDEALDGRLLYSDNYQALKTLMRKYNNDIDFIYIDPPFNTGSDFAYIDKFQDSTWLTLMDNRLKLAKELIKDTGFISVHLDYNASHLGIELLNKHFGADNFRNNISWCYTGPSQSKSYFPRKHDDILLYSKSPNSDFLPQYVEHKSGIHNTGQVFGSSEDSDEVRIKELTTQGKRLEDWWIDIWSTDRYRDELIGFDTQKPEKLLNRLIQATIGDRPGTVLDFFSGSGTTVSTAHKLGKKWIGVEMGEHFYTTVLPRMKETLNGNGLREPCGISKDVDWSGGGFFKYYTLEQYEDTLRNMKYKKDQKDLFDQKNPYAEYIFFADKKFADVLEVETDNIELNFEELYKGIDWSETLSNLLALPIKKVNENTIIFGDNEKEIEKNINFSSMSNEEKLKFIQLIKPLLWWGE